MADMITRCPKCSTAFHITDAHLRSANGSVRCGSCLTVFNGAENLTNNQNPSIKEPEEDELLISDDMDLSELDDELDEELNTLSEQKKIERRKTQRNGEDNLVDEDESWALKLLEEEGHNPEQIGLVAKQENASPDKTRLEPTDAPAPRAVETEQTAPPLNKNATEQAPEPEAKPQAPPKPEKTPPDTNTLLAEFEPEPLEVQIRKKRSFWSSRLLWFFLVVIGASALAAQIAWLQFDVLSRDPMYRPAYEVACQHFGCQLPALKDRTLIKTSNLSIRSHPITPNALLVDVILKNMAEFEQSFPSIVLTFSDLSSKVVAKRTFEPKDYLGGELAGMSHMPRNQPIHISLEIVDPGKGAESYDVYITD